jgi:hypothetical protein
MLRNEVGVIHAHFLLQGSERSPVAYLERRGGRSATPAMLGAASWIPSFSCGSEGPYLGGTDDARSAAQRGR